MNNNDHDILKKGASVHGDEKLLGYENGTSSSSLITH
jgi:hypothetical protein